jgi:hypothetical protein
MSLAVHLNGPVILTTCECPNCGNRHERDMQEEFYHANITHNLGSMANEARIYKHLWRPEEIGVTKAAELIAPLEAGLILLKSNPSRFKAFSAENDWGTYKQFVLWLENYLDACKKYPDALVSVSR